MLVCVAQVVWDRCSTKPSITDLQKCLLLQVAQVLLPGLLVIASSQEYRAGMRRRALSIAHSLANSLSSKQSPTDKDTRRGLGILLEAWMNPICAILQEPISGQVGRFLAPAFCCIMRLSGALSRCISDGGIFCEVSQCGTNSFHTLAARVCWNVLYPSVDI